MMRTMVKKAIKFIVISELLIVATYFISFKIFINLQIASLSSFFIIFGSMYAYKKMVIRQVETENIEEKRELLDEIEDPHGLYDEESDLQTIVKEEKKKIKTINFSDMKKGFKAGFSLFRLIPYVFLVLGFIALKNHGVLDIAVYLLSLLVGIFVAYLSAKEILH